MGSTSSLTGVAGPYPPSIYFASIYGWMCINMLGLAWIEEGGWASPWLSVSLSDQLHTDCDCEANPAYADH